MMLKVMELNEIIKAMYTGRKKNDLGSEPGNT